MINIETGHRKYLRFQFDRRLYQFTVLPFGLCTAPYVFTKILKPIVASLRSKGLKSVIYLDDCLLISESYSECVDNLNSIGLPNKL